MRFVSQLLVSALFAVISLPWAAATNAAAPTSPQASPRRHALLVGVWDYAKGRGDSLDWWNLHSEKDIEAVDQLLINDFGFTQKDITTLTKRSETTHEAIRKAFQELIDATQEGDIVYFHYSGHGQQVPDPNHEEVDGYNQTLVPSDYITRRDGSNNIRNKEIRDWLRQLKAKRPANVTLIFDSCYSGDITKGGRHLVRGERMPASAPPTVIPISTNIGGAIIAPREKGAGGILLRGDADELGYVVISASLFNQVAQETEDDQGDEMGLLTYALTRALAEAKPPRITQSKEAFAAPETTYRDVFERVTDLMSQKNQNQIPAIEGQQDKVLFEGLVRPPQPFTLVHVVNGNVLLRAGSLHGMTQGSTMTLYPPETKDFTRAKSIATAVVGSPDLGISPLTLSDANRWSNKLQTLDRTRAIETEHVYGENALRVFIDDPGRSLPQLVREKLLKLSVINAIVDDAGGWNIRIRPQGGSSVSTSIEGDAGVPPGSWVVEREDGSRIAYGANDDKLYATVRRAIEGEARWRALKALSNVDDQSPVKLEFRVVPVTVNAPTGRVEKREQIGADLPLERSEAGQLVLRDNEYVMFEVRNIGLADAWVSIVDLSNDGKVNAIYPLQQCSTKNSIAAGGPWIRLPWCSVARVGNPSNRLEFYKLIATNEYIDLAPLVDVSTAKGSPPVAGKLSPLAEMFRAATLGQKSTENAAVNPAYWSTSTISFLVGARH